MVVFIVVFEVFIVVIPGKIICQNDDDVSERTTTVGAKPCSIGSSAPARHQSGTER